MSVVNMISGVWHCIAVGEPNPRLSWLISCGWSCGGGLRVRTATASEALETISKLCHKSFAKKRQSLQALVALSFGRQAGVGAAMWAALSPRPSFGRGFAARVARRSAHMGGTANSVWERTSCSDIHTLRRCG